MKTAELKATIREKTGAQQAAKSRKENRIPAVVYGESGAQHVEVDYQPMAKLVLSPELFLIDLHTGNDHKRVIIQDAQFHPLTDKIIHIDFLEAAVGKAAKLSIPVHIVGTSKGVLKGGQLVLKMRHLMVKGVPADLPEHIEVDITDLEIGKSIKVGDLKGFEFIDPANAVVVRVKTARKLEEVITGEEETEEGAEEVEAGEEVEASADAAPAEEKAE
jgi:large subunit ribosomal protein L25